MNAFELFKLRENVTTKVLSDSIIPIAIFTVQISGQTGLDGRILMHWNGAKTINKFFDQISINTRSLVNKFGVNQLPQIGLIDLMKQAIPQKN